MHEREGMKKKSKVSDVLYVSFVLALLIVIYVKYIKLDERSVYMYRALSGNALTRG